MRGATRRCRATGAAVALALLGGALPGQAGVPADAREFLERQRDLAGAGPSWEANLARFNLAYPCGAMAEAREALDALSRLAPADPTARYYRLELNSHDAGLLEQSRAGAARFLAAQAAVESDPETEVLRRWLVAQVERLDHGLSIEQLRRSEVAASSIRARWLPLGAAGVLALAAWAAARWRPRAAAPGAS